MPSLPLASDPQPEQRPKEAPPSRLHPLVAQRLRLAGSARPVRQQVLLDVWCGVTPVPLPLVAQRLRLAGPAHPVRRQVLLGVGVAWSRGLERPADAGGTGVLLGVVARVEDQRPQAARSFASSPPLPAVKLQLLGRGLVSARRGPL